MSDNAVMNSATKKQAVSFINTARRDGWAVQVDALRRPDGRPYTVLVYLFKKVRHSWARISVSFRAPSEFRKGGRWSVGLGTMADYVRVGEIRRGWWDANFQINRLHQEEIK